MNEPESYAIVQVEFVDEPHPGACIFCGVDCSKGRARTEHEHDCPYKTGVWVMNESEATQKCGNPECGCLVGVRCGRCHEPIRAGDVYRFVDALTGLLAVTPDMGLVICASCADKQAEAIREMLGTSL